ncbi:hypothetical protein [Enterococcus malodoratus]|uniref:hypothetical protein n=1 Tax=Enterococcus malodoratus TaxID=71451 RepID=UPI0022E9155D|nr:hypothetical protein [Enterococcus malodoratus]
MKAKELISFLEHNPEADVMVSISEYYERSFQDTGYKQSELQNVASITIDAGAKQIQLCGEKKQ